MEYIHVVFVDGLERHPVEYFTSIAIEGPCFVGCMRMHLTGGNTQSSVAKCQQRQARKRLQASKYGLNNAGFYIYIIHEGNKFTLFVQPQG